MSIEPAPPLAAPPAESPLPRRRRRLRTARRVLLAVLVVYGVAAYLLIPSIWSRYERRHPALAGAPTITHTGSGIPGDQLNVALIGSEENLHRAMLAAHWYPADAITLRSSLRIVADVVMRRPYADAPVSNLYLWGRREDFAFEQPVGDDPKKRHHVRFWHAPVLDAQGQPLWLGSATFDISVGLSDDTGQVTHHIAPDVDRDRDLLMDELSAAGALSSRSWIDGFHKTLEGHNGGGDVWRTDGRLAVGVLKAQVPLPKAPTTLPSGD